jgi:hypothetical protein
MKVLMSISMRAIMIISALCLIFSERCIRDMFIVRGKVGSGFNKWGTGKIPDVSNTGIYLIFKKRPGAFFLKRVLASKKGCLDISTISNGHGAFF